MVIATPTPFIGRLVTKYRPIPPPCHPPTVPEIPTLFARYSVVSAWGLWENFARTSHVIRPNYYHSLAYRLGCQGQLAVFTPNVGRIVDIQPPEYDSRIRTTPKY